MTFSVKDWRDEPDLSTPIDAAALEDVETRLSNYTDTNYNNAVSYTNTYVGNRVATFNVKNYGAVLDGVSDDAAHIQAAIDAAAAAGGGTVIIPNGTALVSTTLVVKDKVTVVGQGHGATAIKLGAAANVPVLKTFVSGDGIVANAERTRVTNLLINGNKAAQTVGGSCHGIQYNSFPTTTAATNDFDVDTMHTLENVIIYNCKDNGVDAAARQASTYRSVWVYNCDGIGIKSGPATSMIGCFTKNTGLEGFLIANATNLLSGCHAKAAGQITAASGRGFHFSGHTSGSVASACIAVDNKDAGFFLDTCDRVTLASCLADSNSTRSSGAVPGFDVLTSTNCRIAGGVSVERKADGTNSYQQNALRIKTTSTNNIIDISHSASGSATIGTALQSGSDSVLGNQITFNAGAGQQTIAFASTITPDPYAGATAIVGQLTGAMTVNAPSNGHAGQRLTLIFQQDATGGRVVTLNAAYVTSRGVGLVPSARTSIVFEYDGTNWIQVSNTRPHSTFLSFGMSGTLVTAVGKNRFVFPQAAVINSVQLIADTAPVGSSILVDVNKNGTTIFSTQANRPSIAASSNSGSQAIPDVVLYAAGDYMTIDIDQVGSGTAGSDLTVVVSFYV